MLVCSIIYLTLGKIFPPRFLEEIKLLSSELHAFLTPMLMPQEEVKPAFDSSRPRDMAEKVMPPRFHWLDIAGPCSG